MPTKHLLNTSTDVATTQLYILPNHQYNHILGTEQSMCAVLLIRYLYLYRRSGKAPKYLQWRCLKKFQQTKNDCELKISPQSASTYGLTFITYWHRLNYQKQTNSYRSNHMTSKHNNKHT